jgi:protein TonB
MLRQKMLRPMTWLLSLGFHAAILLALIGISTGGAALDQGSGNDVFVVEQGIALEGVAKLGEAEEKIEVMDVPPVQPTTVPERVEEVKPDLTNVVTSTEASTEAETVKEEPKPIEDEKPKPVTVQEQAPQVAALEEKSSGAEQRGGDTNARREYLGSVRKSLERNKVNPRSQMSGTVILRFTVGAAGEILARNVQTSSGSKVLDEAALAALERSAPFPPIPSNLAPGPIEVQVPFNFVTR